jgi:hypothetical protein
MQLPEGHPSRWDEETRAALAYTTTSLLDAWRGAIPWLVRGTLLAFGNATKDGSATREVIALRAAVKDQNWTELGFATDESGRWAMLVSDYDDDDSDANCLFNVVWEAADLVGAPGGDIQREIAALAIDCYQSTNP